MNTPNFLVKPKLWNLGFISNKAEELRIKQGLDPQKISNICLYKPEDNQQYIDCNSKNLKPAKQVELEYNIPKIPNTCPCTDYIQAP